jgi:hypothetical protein
MMTRVVGVSIAVQGGSFDYTASKLLSLDDDHRASAFSIAVQGGVSFQINSGLDLVSWMKPLVCVRKLKTFQLKVCGLQPHTCLQNGLYNADSGLLCLEPLPWQPDNSCGLFHTSLHSFRCT